MEPIKTTPELIPDIYYLFMKYLSYKEYSPIYTSCKFLHNTNMYLSRYIDDIYMDTNMDITEASTVGALYVIKWIHTHNTNIKCTTKAMNWASGNGHLRVVKWLYKHRTEGCNNYAMEYATRSGHLDIVRYLYENNILGLSSSIMDTALICGHLDIIQYIHENWNYTTSPYSTIADTHSIYSGKLIIVQWVFNAGVKFTGSTMTYASEYGHLDILIWLYNNTSSKLPKSAIVRAIQNRHKNIVRWIYDNTEPEFSEKMFMDLIAIGDFYTVQKVVNSQDIAIGPQEIDNAAKHGYLDILKFLCNNYAVVGTASSINWASYYGHLDVVKWLYNNRKGRYTKTATKNAIKKNYLNIVQWLYEKGSKCDVKQIIAWAEEFENQDVLDWIKTL